MLFNNPYSLEKAERLIHILNLTPDSKVLDIGCGDGEFLLRLSQATGTQCLGVDISGENIEAAAVKATQLGLTERVRFEVADVNQRQFGTEFDVIICLGAVYAFASGQAAYPEALTQMQRWLKPHGQILVGEGYWKKTPAQAYLDFIGEPVGIYHSHQGNVEVAESHGFIVAYTATSNQDEWDHFEGSFRVKAERAAMANPEDKEAIKKRDAVRAWNTYYHRYGRETMGFGFYLMFKVQDER